MNALTNLVATYNFRGKEYLVQLNSGRQVSSNIDIKVTDKKTFEDWHGSYDASYIENLTLKTGNYKKFDTFLAMLKSGLLKTTHCVTLDLLTIADLEMLRNKSPLPRGLTASHTHVLNPSSNNRRYLIVTYTAEFDRIHYPLAMDYCGLPDPRILQETIKKLEEQVMHLQNQLGLQNNTREDIRSQIDPLQMKVVEVTNENIMLKEHIKKLNEQSRHKIPDKEVNILIKGIQTLENKLKIECESVKQLMKENHQLFLNLEEAHKIEYMLRAQLNTRYIDNYPTCKPQRYLNKLGLFSPIRNRSLENCVEKPFPRNRSGERKVRSARSYFDRFHHSSNDESIFGGSEKGRPQHFRLNTSPKARPSSTGSISDSSHSSEISRCPCKNCITKKQLRKGNKVDTMKKLETGCDKATLMKRIRSVEKLISGLEFK